MFSSQSFNTQLNIIKAENELSSLRLKNLNDASESNANKSEDNAKFKSNDYKSKNKLVLMDELSLGIIIEENHQLSQIDIRDSEVNEYDDNKIES